MAMEEGGFAKSNRILMFNCADTHKQTPPTHPLDLIVRRRSVAVVMMMMMMCLESNRHGNVATVSDAAAEDWRKWQTFDTSFPFFVLLIFLRRTRPVPPFSGAVVFPCLVMFERVFFFRRYLSANDYDFRRLKEIGAFKVFHRKV